MKKVDNDKFIEVWQTSVSVRDVCVQTGLTLGSAYSKALRLRRIGVNLKRMPAQIKRDTQRLIQLANKLSGEQLT